MHRAGWTGPNLSHFSLEHPMNASTQAVQNQTPATLSDVGVAWKGAAAGSSHVLWLFSHKLLRFAAADPKATLAQIGEACATAVGRAKPYSKAWVSRAMNAGRAFKDAPADAAAADRFLGIFHGNTPKPAKAKPAPKTLTADECLAAVRKAAERALKRGCPAAEIDRVVSEAITPRMAKAA
jgi:hypothetical protein